jgi:adenylylsulfate kinase-like enzyme
MVIWIIGQSGSGKTYLGKKIFSKIKSNKKIIIDGDDIRSIFFKNKLGYKISDRKKNGLLIQNLCKFLEEKNFIVICSIQSIFPKMQKENRNFFKKYLQIFIKVPNRILIKRNNKKIYSKKNVVGIDLKFPKPYRNDFILKNNYDSSITKNISKILYKIQKINEFK